MNRFYLGFDAGTQSVKVAIYDEEMNIVASSSSPTTLTYPEPGWVNMDVDEYVELTLEGIRNCINQMRNKDLDPNGIRVIMGDGIICGIVGVDAKGNAVTPYINYLDSRTQADEEEINNWDLSIWGEETGNPEAKCMFPALFARWFLKHQQQWHAPIAKFIHNAPYILSHLAGLTSKDMFIDWGAMSGWGLGYKVEEKVWSEKQLELLGIPLAFMPKIVKPWDIIGQLTPEMANKTGLPVGIPICAGAGDTMQSMIGSGNYTSGQAVDVAGTCSMFCVSTTGIVPELSKKGKGLIFNSGTLPNTYFYWGYIRTGGLALRWFRDNVCGRDEGSYFDKLNEGASKIDIGANGVLFLPYLTGGTNDIKDATGCFLNMSMDTDQAVLWRSVLEAIGYDYMEITDLYRSAGANLERITVTEGGSRSSVWNQIKADMLGSEVVIPKNVEGAVATDCIIGAYAVGDVSDIIKAIEANFLIKETYQTNIENNKFYRQRYDLQKQLIKHDMQDAFSRLRQLRETSD